jgi:hypothetical protein
MRNCGKTEIDGEAWLSHDPHKVETSWEEEEEEDADGIFRRKVDIISSSQNLLFCVIITCISQ